MDIKRAKQEIKDAIEAYLKKDQYGEYKIPVIRQRPILLIGPPGIGKTQIMAQISKECGIGLVSYTITHHTRQSAIGLPFIKEREFGGQSCSVTEYTMSEIIGAVYEKMESTGMMEGILFIDEINCVSETLAPTMLQFLQCKTFGNQQVPGGWIIVAAGNPPEYNKSVRDFDLVTLDRIRKIPVEVNYDVWKEYAYQAGIHPAIISYLDLRKDSFYRIEAAVDGKAFVTARGWEDLSRLIEVYEELGKTVDQQVVCQYVQHRKLAKDFANYLELFYKYRADYGIEDILKGKFTRSMVEKVKLASLDERLSLVGLLIGKLEDMFRTCRIYDSYLELLHGRLKTFMDGRDFEAMKKAAETDYEKELKAEQLTKEKDYIWRDMLKQLDNYSLKLKQQESSREEARDAVRLWFQEDLKRLDGLLDDCGKALNHGFDFIEAGFAKGQEVVLFITELNISYNASWFLKNNGNDRYYKYNKGLLFDERHQSIMEQLEKSL